MSGVSLGVLLARTVSGFVGAAYGWRAMFYLAVVVLVVLAVNLGARTYGLLGAAAELTSPLVGALSDRAAPPPHHGNFDRSDFSILYAVMVATGTSLVGLAFGAVIMDIGVQSGDVSDMSRIL